MATLGLKIYYLRTREKGLNQQQVAAALGVRQATISLLENDVNSPQAALVIRLCRFYDVTPNFLLDEERGVIPRQTERWTNRGAMVTVGMHVELRDTHLTDLGDGRSIYRLQPGDGYFDEDAAALRQRYQRRATFTKAFAKVRLEMDRAEQQLEKDLRGERDCHKKKKR